VKKKHSGPPFQNAGRLAIPSHVVCLHAVRQRKVVSCRLEGMEEKGREKREARETSASEERSSREGRANEGGEAKGNAPVLLARAAPRGMVCLLAARATCATFAAIATAIATVAVAHCWEVQVVFLLKGGKRSLWFVVCGLRLWEKRILVVVRRG